MLLHNRPGRLLGQSPALLGMLALSLTQTLAAPAQAKALYSPAAGVLCDQPTQRCYDQMGLSLGLTRTYFGVAAEQRLIAELGGRRPPRRFSLSNGAFCEVEARTCWRDGRDRTQVADRLTRDLFGALPPSPVPVPKPTPTPTPTPTPPANLSYPSAGVICDQFFKICYDRQGVSQMLSAANFGPVGMRNATAAQQQGLQRQFVLSNGTLCDVSAPGCWSDGTARRIPATAISTQLFGASPVDGGSSATASCRLQRGFRVLFNGSCQLTEQQDGNRRRFVAQLGNGASYTFVSRDGTYRISDGTGGSWPVAFTDRGRSAQFRWSDLSLDVTQNAYIGTPSLGRSLGLLLEGLFN